jgi:N-alpha-acetyltransferase 50
MTLAVLAAYRGRGIGSDLLQSVLDYCAQQQQQQQRGSTLRDGAVEASPIVEIALHVHISNNDAIRFYTEKFGFVRGELVENYYRRIDPPHCYLLYKKLDQSEESLEIASN